MPVCAAVFLMKHGLSEALLTQYSAYFLMPPLVLFWIFFVLVMTQIVAFRKGLTPYLKWCYVFSMAFGMRLHDLRRQGPLLPRASRVPRRAGLPQEQIEINAVKIKTERESHRLSRSVFVRIRARLSVYECFSKTFVRMLWIRGGVRNPLIVFSRMPRRWAWRCGRPCPRRCCSVCRRRRRWPSSR